MTGQHSRLPEDFFLVLWADKPTKTSKPLGGQLVLLTLLRFNCLWAPVEMETFSCQSTLGRLGYDCEKPKGQGSMSCNDNDHNNISIAQTRSRLTIVTRTTSTRIKVSVVLNVFTACCNPSYNAQAAISSRWKIFCCVPVNSCQELSLARTIYADRTRDKSQILCPVSKIASWIAR